MKKAERPVFCPNQEHAMDFICTPFLICLAVVGAEPMPLTPIRDWTSSDGKYSTKAALLSVQQDGVRLKKVDGSDIVVPLSRLSASDREFVSTLTNKVPAKAEQVSPRNDGE